MRNTICKPIMENLSSFPSCSKNHEFRGLLKPNNLGQRINGTKCRAPAKLDFRKCKDGVWALVNQSVITSQSEFQSSTQTRTADSRNSRRFKIPEFFINPHPFFLPVCNIPTCLQLLPFMQIRSESKTRSLPAS